MISASRFLAVAALAATGLAGCGDPDELSASDDDAAAAAFTRLERTSSRLDAGAASDAQRERLLADLRADASTLIAVLEDHRVGTAVPSLDSETSKVLTDAAELVEDDDPALADEIVDARESLGDPGDARFLEH